MQISHISDLLQEWNQIIFVQSNLNWIQILEQNILSQYEIF